jgi:hypothetical protein
VNIAGPRGASLEIAELVEHEQRGQVLRLEVAVPGHTLSVSKRPVAEAEAASFTLS